MKKPPSSFEQNYYKSGNYQKYLDRMPRYYSLAQEIEKFLEAPIMDYGCAVGFLTKAINYLGIECHGYDVSEWAISYGKNEVTKDITNVFRYNQEKTLICLDVLEHMSLKDVNSILKLPYKKLIVRIPVEAKDNEGFYLEESKCDQTHITCMTKKRWEIFFREHGFVLMRKLHKKTIWDSKGVLSRIYVR